MSLQTQILEDLECPICREYIFPPIRQCSTGHAFCYKCFGKLEKCPICRSPKGITRCFALEKIHKNLYFPCKFRLEGCLFRAQGYGIKDHEEYCYFSDQICPLKGYSGCDWSGLYKDVILHCKKKHPNNIYFAVEQRLIWPDFSTLEGKPAFYHIMFKAYNQVFFCNWKFDPKTNYIRWAVSFLGTPDMNGRYSYEISFQKEKVALDTICMKMVCQPFLKRSNFFRDFGTGLLTNQNTLKKYCNPDGDLLYRVRIFDNSKKFKPAVF